MTTETSRPTVDLTDAKRVIEETTKRLLEERNWIIQDYFQRAKQLESEREKELQRNESMLLEMGMNVEDIPPIPHLSIFDSLLRENNSLLFSQEIDTKHISTREKNLADLLTHCQPSGPYNQGVSQLQNYHREFGG